MGKRKKEQKRGICPYCDREKILTEEHVIPDTLYRERGQDQVKVLICHQCNNGMSKEIRDLRNLIVLSLQDSSHPDTEFHIRKIIDTDEKTRSWLAKTLSEAEEFDYVDEEEVVLGVGILPSFNKEPARRALSQVIRGLYLFETTTPLPLDVPAAGFDIPAPFAPSFISKLTQSRHNEPKSSGNGVATWVMFSEIEGGGEFDTAWILIFLEGACFIGGTGSVAVKLEGMWQEMLQSRAEGRRVNGRLRMAAPRLPDGTYYIPPQ